MSCTSTSVMMDSHEEPVMRSDYGTFSRQQHNRRRRHSYHHTRSWSVDHDNIQLLVDRFLAELNRRLDFLDKYGQLQIDAGIERAYSTLTAVRDACSSISDGVLDTGRRRAAVLVDTLEESYNDALAKKETLEQKVQEGVRLMEGILSDFEAKAYSVRNADLGSVAHDFLDEGWRRVDEGLERAREVVDEGIDKAKRAKETIEQSVQRALETAKLHGLIKYEDLPDPWKINPYIHHGYRFHEGKLECLRSTLTLSNESFNIWSHAIGFFLVISIAFYFYPFSAHFSHATKWDVFVAAVFFFAACKCLFCSACWHTFNSISEQHLMERFACVDYTGISLLVAASIMTSEYTAFYCEPVSRRAYMIATAIFGIGGVVLPWQPSFNRADMAWARVLFYVTLSATGALPVFQLVLTRGGPWTIHFYAPMCKSLLVYLGGACLYAGKIPERWIPGRVDYLGASHHLWHLAVLGGILFHYLAMQDFFVQAYHRAQTQCTVAFM